MYQVLDLMVWPFLAVLFHQELGLLNNPLAGQERGDVRGPRCRTRPHTEESTTTVYSTSSSSEFECLLQLPPESGLQGPSPEKLRSLAESGLACVSPKEIVARSIRFLWMSVYLIPRNYPKKKKKTAFTNPSGLVIQSAE